MFPLLVVNSVIFIFQETSANGSLKWLWVKTVWRLGPPGAFRGCQFCKARSSECPTSLTVFLGGSPKIHDLKTERVPFSPLYLESPSDP